MMWLFAILVVLVMGGVVMVAAGRGGTMSDAYDDRPDALVPADRPLEAIDLRRVRFSLAFRGYRMGEVDALLDRLARELEERSSHGADEAQDRLDGPGEGPDTPADQAVRGDEPPT